MDQTDESLKAEVARLLDEGALARWEYEYLTLIDSILEQGFELTPAHRQKLLAIIHSKK